MAFSIIVLFLTGAIIICLAETAVPLFMNRSNVADIMPAAMKGAKISIVLVGICGLLEVFSPGSIVRATNVDIVTGVLFLWSCGLIPLLKMRHRRIAS